VNPTVIMNIEVGIHARESTRGPPRAIFGLSWDNRCPSVPISAHQCPSVFELVLVCVCALVLVRVVALVPVRVWCRWRCTGLDAHRRAAEPSADQHSRRWTGPRLCSFLRGSSSLLQQPNKLLLRHPPPLVHSQPNQPLLLQQPKGTRCSRASKTKVCKRTWGARIMRTRARSCLASPCFRPTSNRSTGKQCVRL